MPTILVVDDQHCIRELLAEVLMDEGYRVETVGDAMGAVQRVRASQPDLVLLDLFLGEPDGWDVLRDMKRQAPYMPVVIFTAYDSFKEDSRLSEAQGYVIKSTDFTELKETISQTLARTIDRQSDFKARTYVSQIGSVMQPF